MTKKAITLFTLITLFTKTTKADEGMWLPMLLEQLNYTDMQAKGLKISAQEIYSVNQSSLKDAVVLFGGGCTGEIISDEGLLLTNHHCGRYQVQLLSTIENNFLKNGFWVMNKKQELPCPGLTITFIISMENVSEKILSKLHDGMTQQERSAAIAATASQIEKESVKGTHYEAKVKSFYYGNEFYLIKTETFKDIRLAGVPPESIGEFGGETDNWVWPRHNGDFSLFRIYADSANHPAAYSASNKPFKPRKSFTINIKGVQEGDFTMVYGFPGRTTEYLPSPAVEMILNTTDPVRVKIREQRLNLMEQAMHGNDTIHLWYAAKYAGIANSYKKWKGEILGLKKFDAVAMKKKYEEGFNSWLQGDKSRLERFGMLMEDFQLDYTELIPLSKLNDYTTEAALGSELVSYANGFHSLVDLCGNDAITNDSVKAVADRMLQGSNGYFKNYFQPLDKKIFAAMMKLFSENIADSLQPELLKAMKEKYNGDWEKYAGDVFKKSFFVSQEKLKELLESFSKKKAKKILNDPAYRLADAFTKNLSDKLGKRFNELNNEIAALQQTYMQAIREKEKEKKIYPDANLTLRVAYGNVKGYAPRDGMNYKFYTTLEGVMEKYDSTSDEFIVPKKLMQLYVEKNYGRYGNKNELPVAFIASNHTTGGNSGSPVLNGNGELIGTNFDRAWEGTMSDIYYNPAICRNIAVDIRYTLFIIDIFAGAKNLVDEMRIVSE